MKKRGQVTVFIIIGMIMLISTALVVYIRSIPSDHGAREILDHPELEPQKIRSYLQTCLDDESLALIETASINGGFINITKFSGDFNQFKGEIYYYHCIYEKGRGCTNKFITRDKIEEDISIHIKDAIDNCVDFSVFEDELGFNVELGDIEIKTDIGSREVLVDVKFPVTLKKDNYQVTVDGVKGLYYSDIGYLHDIAIQIVNAEIIYGFFDQDDFMDNHGSVMIEKHRPYPDTLYLLRKFDERSNKYLTYKFGIKGYDNAFQIGWPDAAFEENLGPWCATDDNNCYANVVTGECPGTSMSTEKPEKCDGPSKIMTNEEEGCQPGGICHDCSDTIKHGDSWCVYEGITGKGLDLVGARHFKKSCFNGIIYTEACRDYRQEICVQDFSINKAVCRVNRFEDCSTITNKNQCLDTDRRDCYWTDEVINNHPESEGKRDRREYLCHPAVPPGFKHWATPFNPLCDLGGETADCDYFECPQKWNDKTSWYCMVQSDCGWSRNIEDYYFEGGFYTTNSNMNEGNPKEGSGFLPSGQNKGRYYDLNLPIFDSNGDYITNKVPVIDLKYENKEGNMEAIMDHINSFSNKASSWDECTFCPCPLGFPIPPCTYDELTAFDAFCSTYKAPDGGSDCHLCTEKYESCTEYKCKSLGKSCNFYIDTDGYPHCNAPSGNLPSYTIDWNHEEPAGFTLLDDSDFTGTKRYLLCNNNSNCVNDADLYNEIGLQPYTPINFTVRIDGSVAACRTSLLPMFSYQDIYPLFSDFDTHVLTDEFEYNAYVQSPYSLTEFLNSFSEFANALYGMDISNLNQKVQQTLGNVQAAGGGSGAAQFEENWNELYPQLEAFYDQFSEEMFEFFYDIQGRKHVVHFICADADGNPSENDLTLKYFLADDKTPPVLESTQPKIGKTVPKTFNFTAKFNEPVECRYDFTQKSFRNMKYELGCPQYNFLLFSAASVTCLGEITFPDTISGNTSFYIRCLDQPGREEQYVFNIRKDGGALRTLKNYPGLFEVTGTRIKINNGSKLINETYNLTYNFGNNADQIEIELWLDNSNIECGGRKSTEPLSPYGPPYFAGSDVHIGCTNEQGRAKCVFNIGTSEDVYLKISCQEQRTLQRNEGLFKIDYFIQ
jgi:hypothetical protein